MSHELAFVDGVASMVYRQEFGEPWHGLGQPITEKMSATQAMNLANADYKVVKADVVDHLPDGTQIPSKAVSLYSNHGDKWNYLTTLKSHKNYQLIQNRDISAMLDFSDDNTPALSEVFDMDTMGVLSDSKRSFFCLRMDERTIKVNGKRDPYVSHFMVTNDFAAGVIFVSQARTRTVCRNTMIAALAEADGNDALWTISHRSNPKERLEFRLDLERVLQASDDSYFAELEAMVDRMWKDQEEKEKFVNMVFPDPKESSKIRQAKAIRPGMREAVVVPIMEMADADRTILGNLRERAERNREGMKKRIEFYENEFSASSLYAAYQGATDWICWSKERGDMENLGQSIITPTGERYKNLQRVTEASRYILNPKYKNKRRKQQVWDLINNN